MIKLFLPTTVNSLTLETTAPPGLPTPPCTDTMVALLDRDGVSELGSNDDKAPGDLFSRLMIAGPLPPGVYYARVKEYPSPTCTQSFPYVSYRLTATADGAPLTCGAP